MARFGTRSRERRDTCHPDLILILDASIVDYDYMVLEGHRLTKKQQGYYAIGRTVELDRGIITNKDGIIKLSRHQSDPSTAVDCVPWFADSPHIRWDDIAAFKAIAQVIMKAAERLGIPLSWGGGWKSPVDYPHFQLRSQPR